MKEKVKVFSVFLILVLLFSQFAGCGQRQTSNGGNEAGKQVDVPKYLNLTGFPIVKEPITLKIAVKKGPQQPEYSEMLMIKEYEKMTGIHIDWDHLPSTEINERKNLILASGDLPDAFMKCGLVDKELLTYGSQGTFIKLDPLLDKYAPNFKKALATYPSVSKGAPSADGNIYTFVNINTSMAFAVSKFYINSKWLNAVGKKMPVTTDELYDVLKAFKEKDPNGNGRPDEIPISSNTGIGQVIQSVQGAWGLGNRGTQHTNVDMDEKTGKLRFYRADPKFREVLEYLNKLFTDGLLDQEVFTQTSTQFQTKAQQNLFGAHVNYPTQIGQKYQDDFEGLTAALKGPQGDQLWTRIVGSITGNKGSFVITNANKYPEATVRWVDYFYGDEGIKLYYMGIEGVSYKVTSDKKYEYVDDINKNPNGLNLDQALSKYVPHSGGGNPSIITDNYFKGTEMYHSSVTGTERLKPYLSKEIWELFTYMPNETEKKAALEGDINSYINDMINKFITGKTSFSEWDNYVSHLKDVGLDEYMKIYQSGYDRYKK